MAPMAGSGSGGYAARVMKEMYGGSLPRAATQLLRDHARIRSSSAPARSTDKVWATGMGERGKARQIDLRVPRVGQKKEEGLARPPKLPTTGRRGLSHILKETSNYEREQERPVVHGRDCSDAEKQRLQNQYAFDFGSALPTTGISGAVAASLEASELDRRRRQRGVSFSPDCARGQSPLMPPTSGLSAEQERIAVDIVEGVRARQRELDGVDQSLAGFVQRTETRGEAALRPNLRKEMVGASKKRLELKNAISRDMQDLDKLFDLAPAESQ